MEKSSKIKIAIFASGSGSNAENLVNYFSSHARIEIVHIFCNKPEAFVLARAKRLGIATMVFNRSEFYELPVVAQKLNEMKIDYIVLAGFLWLIPKYMVETFPGKIINIHPALLPKFGGKGMYGMYVHEAVVASKEKETGITIHMVNEKYDEGDVVFQSVTSIHDTDTAELVAQKVHQLEYEYYPVEIEKHILKIFK